ncbi:MAG TPA: hypothetical protein VJQ25_10195 [Nitrospira sp.]|nr:hypothetical protein [Nitrospira sp.]
MSVLDEDIGHPAYKPDKDLVEALMACINRETNRLTVGNLFGSLLVVMRMVIYSQKTIRQPDRNAVRGLIQMMALYIGKPPTNADDPSLTLRRNLNG